MKTVARWSTVIGFVALVSSLPTIAEIVRHQLARGSVDEGALVRLLAVPLLYVASRFAERQM